MEPRPEVAEIEAETQPENVVAMLEENPGRIQENPMDLGLDVPFLVDFRWFLGFTLWLFNIAMENHHFNR